MEMSTVKLLIFSMSFIACFSVSETVICSYNICSFVDPCKNGGTCRQDSECKAACVCPPKFDGKYCNHTNESKNCRNECTPDTCHNHGKCTFDNESCSMECKCDSGYAGKKCNHEVCNVMVCVHGSCSNINNVTSRCQCEDGWIGETCNIGCTRNCLHGECILHNGDEICSCKGYYKPDTNCTIEEIPPTTVEKWDKRYLGFLAIPLLLSFVLAVMVYVMWRYRVTFILKIIYTFQNYEDHAISNNIINAVEKSRRTILVLSPDYVISEWTRMEYQIAHQEMLKKRQKIIPIIFRDLNKLELDKNLSYILKSITYLEWPGSNEEDRCKLEKFWGKLRLTMPKKRELLIEDGKNTQKDNSTTVL
ncbi:delta-like protein C isoform X2 [Octopus bimaculoides]|uniref:delta-like protein C isoform X2 n=1 Tax=Octopus bimaculoides TaxID=37653 RepID=UPI0022E4D43F|nr:delta-like protein C isoform X2 [Octopus bimaculoides]